MCQLKHDNDRCKNAPSGANRGHTWSALKLRRVTNNNKKESSWRKLWSSNLWYNTIKISDTGTQHWQSKWHAYTTPLSCAITGRIEDKLNAVSLVSPFFLFGLINTIQSDQCTETTHTCHTFHQLLYSHIPLPSSIGMAHVTRESL